MLPSYDARDSERVRQAPNLEQTMTETSSTLKRIATDGLLIALVTASSYLNAYLYEIGISRVFGYPKSLIEIDITNIMTSLTIVILFGFIAFLILELFSTLLRIDDFAFSKILKSATATKFAAMSLLMAMSTISLLPIIWLLSDGSRYFFFSNIAEIRPIATLALLALEQFLN